MRLRFGPRDLATTFEGPTLPPVRLGDVGEQAHATLKLAVEALAEAGATAWVTYGSLLGLVREGRLLPHDNDIDMAVLADADPERIRQAMAARGLTLALERRTPTGVSKLKFNRAAVVIDLYFVHQEGRVLVDYCAVLERSLLRGTHLSQAVEMRELAGISVPVPTNAEAYLAHLYGPGWRQPVTRWNWYLSPPNAEIIAHWTEAPRLLERLLRWKLRWGRSARA